MIDFFESPSGDKKKTLLTKVPVKVVNILLNEPTSVVVVKGEVSIPMRLSAVTAAGDPDDGASVRIARNGSH